MRRVLPLVVGLVLLTPVRASAVYQCGAQTDTCPCHAYDPYPCCSNGGNCTWWAWEAACCNWNVGLGSWGDAYQWAGNARASGYDVRDCHTPVTGTIANEGITHPGGLGHVAWVTSLRGGGGVQVQEQNCDYGPGSMDVANYGLCWFNQGYIARGGQVQCNPGDTQTQGCGGCGIQTRGCGSNGQWGGWSGCGGGGGCAPGQTQTQGCGACGSQTRTCGGDCQWGGWSACTGQGECSPGQTQQQSCCDCGSQQRTCDNSCHWGGWGACAGPDPAGPPDCDTGKLGVCGQGQERCVSGCLACVQVNQPSPEICDGLDNDCNGLTDDGDPQQLSSPPPAYAASVVDASFPRSMAAGGASSAWVVFRNDGTATWHAGQVSLRSDAAAAGTPSRLAPVQGWRAFDTPAVLDHDVAPGETAAFKFPIEAQAGADIDETFTLRTPGGQDVACPRATIDVSIALDGTSTTPAETSTSPSPRAKGKAKAGCATANVDAGALLLLVILAAFRRRRWL